VRLRIFLVAQGAIGMANSGLVFIVDDDSSCRAALERLLTAAGLRVKTYASGQELLVRLLCEPVAHDARCVLADLCMPGLDGLQLQDACAAAGVSVPFVFLTGHADVPSAVSAMRHGAVDFIDKCDPPHALLSSLEKALERDSRAGVERARRTAIEHRFKALTAREREVLGHVVHGRMNKQIAAALGIHERTVKLHRNAITNKVGVRSVAELTTLAGQGGLLDDPKQSFP
jgi:FixJ family two-component response regulator